MNYGFIGCGNMAGAIIKGWLRAEYIVGGDVWIYEKNPLQAAAKISELGANLCEDYKSVFANADIVFLGVKPNNLPELLPGLKAALSEYPSKLIVSMLAGTELSKIEDGLGLDADLKEPGCMGEQFSQRTASPVIRIMPNLGAAYNQGVTAICGNASATAEQIQIVSDMFAVLGMAIVLEEKDFPVYTAIAGCGPAFVFLFIEALAKAACKYGMSKKTAAAVAAQMVRGSGEMIVRELENGSAHPWELIDRVCSPGGTTIEGIVELERLGFPSAVAGAVTAAVEKDERIRRS